MHDLYAPTAVVFAINAEFASLLSECGEEASPYASLFMQRGYECRPMQDGYFQLRCHYAFPSPELDQHRADMHAWYLRLLELVPADHQESCRAVLDLNYPERTK